MMFADDIVICSESMEQVEVYSGEKTNENHQKQQHMYMNEKRTGGKVKLEGVEVVQADEFKYLYLYRYVYTCT